MKTSLVSIFTLLLLMGSGCTPLTQSASPIPQVPAVGAAVAADIPELNSITPNTEADNATEDQLKTSEVSTTIGLYKDWNRIVIEEMIALYIPPTCIADAGPETSVIVCPTKQNPTPTPAMYITFHGGGEIVILRWEDLEWEGWDDVVSSIQILTPLTEEIHLTIQK